jgi:hypothetical protein
MGHQRRSICVVSDQAINNLRVRGRLKPSAFIPCYQYADGVFSSDRRKSQESQGCKKIGNIIQDFLPMGRYLPLQSGENHPVLSLSGEPAKSWF